MRFRWPLFRDILRVGAVAALVTLSTNLTIMIGTALVGEFGTAAIAGYGTGARLEYLLVPLVFGLGAPLVAMVGTSIGAGNRDRALRVAWIGAGIATALTEAIGLCAAAFPYAWLSLFDTDPAMLEGGARYLRVVGPFYGMLGLALSLYFASQGAGRLAWPLAGNLVRLAIAAAGGFVALRWTGDISHVFLAQSAALVAFGLINAVSVAGGAWFGRLRWPTKKVRSRIPASILKEKHMGKLEGKIALITGGNSGIGLATAKQFVNEGAYVFIKGRREAELAAAVNEIGRNVTGVQGDVSNLGDLDRLFAQIKREKGKLDIVFANAGVAKYAPFGKITEELYDSIFNINVKGLLFTVQKALPLLPDGASIILNASIVASKGLSSNSVYSATKAAVRSFARTWTTDLKDRRIRVNAVSPGSIDTPGLSDLLASSETGQQRLKMISNAVPLGRLGTPNEIAKAVVFLASDDSSYVTGTELFVDGGFAQV